MAPRDYFAGLAMQSLIRSSKYAEMIDDGSRLDFDELNGCFSELSIQAYMLADQMAEVRVTSPERFGQLAVEFFGREEKESN